MMKNFYSKFIGLMILTVMTVAAINPVSAATSVTKIYTDNDCFGTIITSSDNDIINSRISNKINQKITDINSRITEIKKDLTEKINNIHIGLPAFHINNTTASNDTAADESSKDKVPEKTPENNQTSKPAEYPEYITKVIELTNARREQYGVPALKLSDALCKSAQGHADDMYTNNYFSHTSQDGRTLRDRIEKFSTDYNCVGENIAMGYETPESVVEGWMNSEGHRENILDASYTEIGVGYNNGYWVQNFGG